MKNLVDPSRTLHVIILASMNMLHIFKFLISQIYVMLNYLTNDSKSNYKEANKKKNVKINYTKCILYLFILSLSTLSLSSLLTRYVDLVSLSRCSRKNPDAKLRPPTLFCLLCFSVRPVTHQLEN